VRAQPSHEALINTRGGNEIWGQHIHLVGNV
jgi:hypothetical protein